MSKEHNNLNMIIINTNTLGLGLILKILNQFLLVLKIYFRVNKI